MRYLKTNTATIVTVGPFFDKTDGVTIETGLTITNERITFVVDANDGSAPTLVLDNVTGATSGTSNDLNYITNNDAGLMQLELAAANVNYLGRAMLTITDAANHVPVFHEFMILPAVVYDALVAGTDYLTVDAVQIEGVDATNQIRDAVVDDATRIDASALNTLSGHDPGEVIMGATDLGTGAGLTSLATAANLTTLTGYVDTEVAAILAAVDTEVAAIKAKTDNLPASPAAVGSAMTLSAGAITSGSFAAGAIDAAAIAADAIGASELAADAAAEIGTAVWASSTRTLSSFGTLVTDIWAAGTRTLTSAADSAGVTTLLSRIVGTLATGTHNPQSGDAYARLGAPAGASVSADVAAVKAQTAAIEADTGTDGVVVAAASKTGYSLTATTGLGNQTANITGNLSGSVGSVTGAVGSVTGAVGSVTGAVGSVTGAVGSVTGNVGGNVAGSVASVTNAVTVGTNNDKTGYSLSAAGVQAIWDALTSALTTVGSVGKRIVDNLDGTITSRLAGASYTAPPSAATNASAVRSELATELGRVDAAVSSRSSHSAADVWAAATRTLTSAADSAGVTTLLSRVVGTLATGTHNAQSGDAYARLGAPTGASVSADVAALTGYVDTEVAAILAAVDTEVAAIKAKTDNLPASPAAVGSAMALTSAYDAAKTAATQASVDDLPTNAELATALAGADDAVLAAVAALNNLSSAQAQTAAAAALTAYDPPTKAELDSAVAPLATAAAVTAGVWDAARSGHAGAGTFGATDEWAGSVDEAAIAAAVLAAADVAPIKAALANAAHGGPEAMLSLRKIIVDNYLTDEPAVLLTSGAASAPTLLIDSLNAGAVIVSAPGGHAMMVLSQSGILHDAPVAMDIDGYVSELGTTAKQNVADAMLLAPSAGAAEAGSVDAHLDDILEDTGTTLPGLLAALSELDLDTALEGTVTVGEALRVMLAALAGVSAGGGSATITFAAVDGESNRITATVDANGNRTAVTLDGAA